MFIRVNAVSCFFPEQLQLNYTVSDNVFLEQLYKIRQLEQRLPMMSNINQLDLIFDRPSGLAVKIKVKDIYLVPEYVDFDHKDDIEYVMNHRGFPQDIKDSIANVVENYCRYSSYRKNPKTSDIRKIAVLTLKIEQVGFILE